MRRFRQIHHCGVYSQRFLTREFIRACVVVELHKQKEITDQSAEELKCSVRHKKQLKLTEKANDRETVTARKSCTPPACWCIESKK
jgi:hypothetical protein